MTGCGTVADLTEDWYEDDQGIDRSPDINPFCVVGNFIYDDQDTETTQQWGDRYRAAYLVNCEDDPPDYEAPETPVPTPA